MYSSQVRARSSSVGSIRRSGMKDCLLAALSRVFGLSIAVSFTEVRGEDGGGGSGGSEVAESADAAGSSLVVASGGAVDVEEAPADAAAPVAAADATAPAAVADAAVFEVVAADAAAPVAAVAMRPAAAAASAAAPPAAATPAAAAAPAAPALATPATAPNACVAGPFVSAFFAAVAGFLAGEAFACNSGAVRLFLLFAGAGLLLVSTSDFRRVGTAAAFAFAGVASSSDEVSELSHGSLCLFPALGAPPIALAFAATLAFAVTFAFGLAFAVTFTRPELPTPALFNAGFGGAPSESSESAQGSFANAFTALLVAAFAFAFAPAFPQSAAFGFTVPGLAALSLRLVGDFCCAGFAGRSSSEPAQGSLKACKAFAPFFAVVACPFQ
mmetsp:Transcript_69448/g.123772  ORF Transcript_69448/g.123772 Transcript_69448/m.123772 type:complete len:385 (+) Transcript_69448:862-2016(+)